MAIFADLGPFGAVIIAEVKRVIESDSRLVSTFSICKSLALK